MKYNSDGISINRSKIALPLNIIVIVWFTIIYRQYISTLDDDYKKSVNSKMLIIFVFLSLVAVYYIKLLPI